MTKVTMINLPEFLEFNGWKKSLYNNFYWDKDKYSICSDRKMKFAIDGWITLRMRINELDQFLSLVSQLTNEPWKQLPEKEKVVINPMANFFYEETKQSIIDYAKFIGFVEVSYRSKEGFFGGIGKDNIIVYPCYDNPIIYNLTDDSFIAMKIHDVKGFKEYLSKYQKSKLETKSDAHIHHEQTKKEEKKPLFKIGEIVEHKYEAIKGIITKVRKGIYTDVFFYQIDNYDSWWYVEDRFKYPEDLTKKEPETLWEYAQTKGFKFHNMFSDYLVNEDGIRFYKTKMAYYFDWYDNEYSICNIKDSGYNDERRMPLDHLIRRFDIELNKLTDRIAKEYIAAIMMKELKN